MNFGTCWYYHLERSTINTTMKKVKSIKVAISKLFWIVVTVLCLIFVIWQAIQCCSKYVGKPKATELTIEKAAKHSFPAITICPDAFGGDPVKGTPMSKYNMTRLEECEIEIKTGYYEDTKKKFN